MTTFSVEQTPNHSWQIVRYDPGRSIGNVIGRNMAKAAALLTARLLAGRSAAVIMHPLPPKRKHRAP